jgi:hypothetical protein
MAALLSGTCPVARSASRDHVTHYLPIRLGCRHFKESQFFQQFFSLLKKTQELRKIPLILKYYETGDPISPETILPLHRATIDNSQTGVVLG